MWQADLHCSALEMCPALVCSTDGKFPVCTAAHNYCLEGRRAHIYHPSRESRKGAVAATIMTKSACQLDNRTHLARVNISYI